MWGAAVAAHQVEGNNINSDAWLMEQIPGTMYKDYSGDACNFYHLYEQDILLLKFLGFNSFRFSIEWSRIEPIEGFYSEAELNHYSKIIDKCIELRIIPIVTLHHFTSPRWLISKGGWKNKEVITKFSNYVKVVVEKLGDRVKHFCTINEANTPVQLSINGLFSGDTKKAIESSSKMAAKYFDVNVDDFCPFFPNASDEISISNVIKSHEEAFKAIKKIDNSINVGVTLSLQNIINIEPNNDGEKFYNEVNIRFLKEMGTIGDFVGVPNYTRVLFNSKGRVTETENLADWY
ncbi:family 1 glycosylhydrolase [Sebaldella sp. S0638]|nr:family 1 glycosylhydrolase [Sebaldella sp. S0638]